MDRNWDFRKILACTAVLLLFKASLMDNDGVDFSVDKNEIHAVVGENGAGKTTLMKILYGLEHPDSGSILFHDSEVQIRSPLDAGRLGIFMS